jgi:hypothetical protein
LTTATTSPPQRAANGSKDESGTACRLAREHLLLASSRAVFDLLSKLDAAESPADVRVRLQAAALVRESVRLPRRRQSAFLTEVLTASDNDDWEQPA